MSNKKELVRETVIIGRQHYQNDGSTYVYNIGRNVKFEKGSTVQVQSLSIFNSTYNITSQYNNNQFTIRWINGDELNVIIPDGYYSYADIDKLIEYYLIEMKWFYIVNNIAIYSINTVENPVRYKGQLDISIIPSLTDATNLNYKKPVGADWDFPAVASTPQIIMNSGLGKIFGFSARLTHPPTAQSVNYSYLSDTVPILSPVYSYVLTTNLLNTSLNAQHNNILTQVPINKSFGQLIQYETGVYLPISIHPNFYSQIVMKFYDQDMNVLKLNDPQLTLILVLEYYE